MVFEENIYIYMTMRKKSLRQEWNRSWGETENKREEDDEKKSIKCGKVRRKGRSLNDFYWFENLRDTSGNISVSCDDDISFSHLFFLIFSSPLSYHLQKIFPRVHSSLKSQCLRMSSVLYTKSSDVFPFFFFPCQFAVLFNVRW